MDTPRTSISVQVVSLKKASKAVKKKTNLLQELLKELLENSLKVYQEPTASGSQVDLICSPSNRN